MDFGEDQRVLGSIDGRGVRDRVTSLTPDAWLEQSIRQQTYEVHKQTQSIVLLFCDENWPQGEIYRDVGWARLNDVVIPLIDEVITNYYEPNGILLRAMVAKLMPRGKILPHRDTLESFHIGHRIHVPLLTNPGVRYTIAGKPYAFEVGKAYEINNQRKHSVMNLGSSDRLSLIFDYIPPDRVPDGQQSNNWA